MKRGTIAIVALVAVMLGGIAYSVVRLYDKPDTGEGAPAASLEDWDVLRAVPSDAAAVLVFDGSSRASAILADSTGFLQAVTAPGNRDFAAFLSSLGRREVAVSLHNSGSLVPLVAAKVQPSDTLPGLLARKAGLKVQTKDGFLFASRSETFVGAGVRHLDEGISILGSKKLRRLLKDVSGPAVVIVSHSHAAKLLQVYAGPEYRKGSFVKDLTPWSAWSVKEFRAGDILLEGTALPGEAPASLFRAFSSLPSHVADFPEVSPYFTSSALSVPIRDAASFIEARRNYEDGLGKLAAFNKALLAYENWFIGLQPKEIAKISFVAGGGKREAILVKSAKEISAGKGVPNRCPGGIAAMAGEDFKAVDTLVSSIGGKWTVFCDRPTLDAFEDPSFLEYSLKNRLAEASVSLPEGFVAFASLTEDPALATKVFSEPMGNALKAFASGAGFAPAWACLDFSGDSPSMKVRVQTRTLKGNKVQVMGRDTTVNVPGGLFPVTNFQTGKTNYLYQNSHLSICLRDEKGKDVWGIPFKEPLCGRVKDIDYYNNKKIQFLFAAGDKLYALDRLGHWVNGFPVTLPSAVKLGPDVYDFTGAGGYTVMVLHRDNSLERYNLHGKKPEGWKGIMAPETVKDLPELLELGGKRYWVVRTSVRTLVYPFNGGEPLVKEDGGKMLRPDTPLKVTSKGVSAECYDGKTREYKL